jgi:hypothetical protein
MAQIIEGPRQPVDRQHGRVVIGAEAFDLLEGWPRATTSTEV